MEEVQSWWEVPNITYFCSLFRQAFNLLEFDIEELEEELVLDGIIGGSSFLQELTIRFLKGCYWTNNITSLTWEQYLRDILQKRWVEEEGRPHPFPESFSSFCLLTLRTKVEILHALCNYRLDSVDVNKAMKGLEAESLRIQSLGQDEHGNVYWYFYGTRLYKEEAVIESVYLKDWDREWQKQKKKVFKMKKRKRGRPRKHFGTSDGENEESDEDRKINLENSPPKSRWSVVCTTEQEWYEFVERFRRSKSTCERLLYRSLTENFLPVLKQLFLQKEKNMHKRFLEMAPRRSSARIEQKKHLKEEEERIAAMLEAEEHQKKLEEEERRQLEDIEKKKEWDCLERKRRNDERNKSTEERASRLRARHQNSYFNSQETELTIEVNQDISMLKESEDINSLSLNLEELLSKLCKVLDAVKSHKSAWPFLQPVNESYAPNYYSIIKDPMDLSTMEQKIKKKEYSSEIDMIDDFKKMVENCKCYNGKDSKYTIMANSLIRRFQKSLKKYCFIDLLDYDDSNPNVDDKLISCTAEQESAELSLGGAATCTDQSEESFINGQEEFNFKDFNERSFDKPKRKKKRKRRPGMKAIEALAQAAEQALKDAAGSNNFQDFSCTIKDDSLSHESSAFPGLKITTIQSHPASLLAKYYPCVPIQDNNSNETTSSPFSYSLTSDSNQDLEQISDCQKLRRDSVDSLMSCEENRNSDCISDTGVDMSSISSDSSPVKKTDEELVDIQSSERDKNFQDAQLMDSSNLLDNVCCSSKTEIPNSESSGIDETTDACQSDSIPSSLDESSLNKMNQMVCNISNEDNIIIDTAVHPSPQLTLPVVNMTCSISKESSTVDKSIAVIEANKSSPLPSQQLPPEHRNHCEGNSHISTVCKSVQQSEFLQNQEFVPTSSDLNINPGILRQAIINQDASSNSLDQEMSTVSTDGNVCMNIIQPSDMAVPVKKRAYPTETALFTCQNANYGACETATVSCSQNPAHNSSVPSGVSAQEMKTVTVHKSPHQVVLRPDKQFNSNSLPQDKGQSILPSKNDFIPHPYTTSIPSFTRQCVIIPGPLSNEQNYSNPETFNTCGVQPLMHFGPISSNSTSSGDYYGVTTMESSNPLLHNKDMGIQNYRMLNSKSNSKSGINLNIVQTSSVQQKNANFSSNVFSHTYSNPSNSHKNVHVTQKSSSSIPHSVATFTQGGIYNNVQPQTFSTKASLNVSPMFMSCNSYSRTQNPSVHQPANLVKPQQTQMAQKQSFAFNHSDSVPVKNQRLDSQYPPVFRELEPKFPVSASYSSRPQFAQYPQQFVQGDQNSQYIYHPQRVNPESIRPPNFIPPHMLPGTNYHSNSTYVTRDCSSLEMFKLSEPHSENENNCDKYAYLKSLHRSSLK